MSPVIAILLCAQFAATGGQYVHELYRRRLVTTSRRLTRVGTTRFRGGRSARLGGMEKPSVPEIVGKAVVAGIPYVGGSLVEVISGIQKRREYVAETALGVISERVGEDALMSMAEREPEIEALLWTALQAVAATGVESKRKLLVKVVANAMTSTEPIDMEQLQTQALAELDAPHFRALARLAHAEDLDAAEGKTDKQDSNLNHAAAKEPVPVLAALIRTGVVYPAAMVDQGNGLGRAPSPRELGVSGVTDFGWRLLADLQREGW
jgi:hypothetical protein